MHPQKPVLLYITAAGSQPKTTIKRHLPASCRTRANARLSFLAVHYVAPALEEGIEKRYTAILRNRHVITGFGEDEASYGD